MTQPTTPTPVPPPSADERTPDAGRDCPACLNTRKAGAGWPCPNCSPVSSPSSPTTQRGGVYIASRSRHGKRWVGWRNQGVPITASWIDESGEGETDDWPDLWQRCIAEASACSALVFYAPPEDAPWKGALVEVGAALANGRPVFIIGNPGRCSFSFAHHPLVTTCDSLGEAFDRAAARLASDAGGRGEEEREDAMRYRFLRDNPLGLRAVDGNAKYPPPTAEQMDRYVDHARETAATIDEAYAEIRASSPVEVPHAG